jgi:hypothetical protein
MTLAAFLFLFLTVWAVLWVAIRNLTRGVGCTPAAAKRAAIATSRERGLAAVPVPVETGRADRVRSRR